KRAGHEGGDREEGESGSAADGGRHPTTGRAEWLARSARKEPIQCGADESSDGHPFTHGGAPGKGGHDLPCTPLDDRSSSRNRWCRKDLMAPDEARSLYCPMRAPCPPRRTA